MSEAQGGVCKICGNPPKDKLGGSKEPMLVVDHDHSTGQIRGLLCNNCNVAIAHAKDNPSILVAMANYLQTDR